jgi:hypothetical protein
MDVKFFEIKYKVDTEIKEKRGEILNIVSKFLYWQREQTDRRSLSLS